MNRLLSRGGASVLTSAFCLLAVGRLSAQSTSPVSAQSTPNDETVVLSPFVVTTDTDQGYSAKDTLAGTRIRTDLKDVGSSISVVTEKFLKDTNSKNATELLVYTPSTEVAGQGGNFLGQGDGMYLTNAASGASTTTRVRGLAQADNTRDFFLTDIPWDGYNVGRVDLQRGPNAILFGIGSPAGIVNTSLNPAAFRNSAKVENEIDSYGTVRNVVDLNRVLLPHELAIRVSLLDDQTKYRQNPAFKSDRRIYGALTWDPAALNRGSAHTSFSANFEAGHVVRNDPMQTPPIDYITPWFTAYTAAQRAAGFSAADPSVYSPSADVTNALVQKYGMYLGNWNNSRPQNLSVTDPWLGAPGGRVFDGAITTYNGGSPGFTYLTKQENYPVNSTVTGSVLGYNGVVGITSYAAGVGGYANNAKLVGSTIGAYKAKSLADPSIFDFYNHLLSGPNQEQFNRFRAFNTSLRQTFLDDKLGFELAYDHQEARFGQTSFISNDGTGISIDIMKTLIDGTLNPNFGRPVVYAGGGSAGFGWTDNTREVARATGFADLNFADLTGKDSFLGKVFGRNVFTGLYTDQKNDSFNASGNRTYIADSFAPQASNGAVGQASRDDIFAVYLGSPLTGANASGISLQGIKTTITPPALQTVNQYNDSTNSWQSMSLALVNNDLAGDRDKTYRLARKTADEVKSSAIVWQGYWLGGTVIPMFGYRTDKDVFQDAGNPPGVPANPYGQAGLVNPFDPSFNLKTRVANTVNSKTYSLVTHLPESWRRNLPGHLDVSLVYDKSENFQPDSSRRDILGNAVANPAGNTKEYGFAITALHDKLTLKVMRYETKVANATLDSSGISGQYLIGAVEAWGQKAAIQFSNSLAPGGPLVGNASTLYGHSSDGHQVTWQPAGPVQGSPGAFTYSQAALDATYNDEKASVAAWLAEPVPASFQQAWALTDYATGGGSTNYGASGLVVTGDTLSKGTEIELIANPMKGLDVSLNVSKTFATRTNLAKSYTDWITTRYAQFQGPAGEMRLWGPQSEAQGGESALGKYTRETMSGYNLFQALQGAAVPELRPWRANLTVNYTFQSSDMKGFNVGGAYRWQDADETGFPVIGSGTGTDPYKFDVNNPYKGKSETVVDTWVGYERKLEHGIKWRIQLNVRNLFATKKLQVATVEPDGSPAALRIPEPRTISLSNTFSF